MSLLAPLFLLGLLTIALPIWLHRMNFSDPPSQFFSSIRLMKHSELITATEKKLRYLLLLAARIAALLFLVLLFAEPVLRSNSPLASGSERQQTLVILDQSLSMSAPGLWQQAIDKAESRIDAMTENETARIVGAGADIRLLTDFSTDKTALKQALRRLEPEYSTLDYGQLVAALDELAAAEKIPTQIHFISDAQASNLPQRFSDLVPRRANGLILDQVLSSPGQNANWSISANYSDDKVSATLLSHAGAARQMQVSLAVEGKLRETQSVDVSASGAALVNFDNLNLEINQSRLELSIDTGEPDALAADDKFYLSANSSDSLSVLLLSSGTSPQSAVFLETALKSIRNPSIDTEVVISRADTSLALADYDVVIVSDVATPSANLLNALTSYAQNGGTLLAIAGPASRNQGGISITGHRFRETPITGARIDSEGLLIQQPLHGAVSGFSGAIGATLYQPQELLLLDGDQVIISTNNGYPWLLEHKMGLGRALILSHSLQPEDTDLSLIPEFVPLLRSWVKYLGGSDELPASYATGEQIQVGLDRSQNRAAPVQQVFLPSGEPLLSLQQQSQIQSVRFEIPGIYGLQTSRGEHLVAVNVPVQESDLTPMSEELLSQWKDLASPRQAAQNQQIAETLTDRPIVNKSLEGWLLPILALIILAESILGNAHLRVRRESIA